MEIRPLDPHDDKQMRRFHEIAWRAEKDDGRPWNAMFTYDEMAAYLRVPTADQELRPVAAYDGEQMVGCAWLALTLLDNTDKAWCFVCVEPERRRRGIGSTLLEHLVDLARAEGRTTMTSNAAYSFEERDTAAQLQFAHRHGFTVANMEIQRTLRLPVPEGLLDEIAAEAAPHHADYAVETYVDGIPDGLLDSYCRLANQLILDAPMGDLDYEEEALTPEVLLAKQERTRQMGRRSYHALALRDGEVVAHTDLAIARGDDEAHQWGTLVRRDHRGHRLGAAVKVANLRQLQHNHPDAASVVTTNAEVNAAMIGINERLGFEAVAVVPAFKRAL
jgi:GNAT superfamily N-acetyltransferase